MKKYVYILLYLIIGQLYVFAAPTIGILYQTQEFECFRFISENKLDVRNWLYQNKLLKDGTYHYELSYEEGLPYISISGNGVKRYFLLLSNEQACYFYDTKTGELVISAEHTKAAIEPFVIYKRDKIRASSELREGKTVYSVENLSTEILLPWVPAGGKNGIGATLTIHDMYGEFLILGSGYVSVKNRALWTKNARPKKLKIQYKKTGIVKYVDLKDTPDLQTIVMYTDEDYKNQTIGSDIVITIMDVYEGTTYSDVCINILVEKT